MQRFFLSLALALSCWAQGTHPLTGRKIAGVMGFGGADWLERPERIQEENPDAAVEALELKPGMVIADIGAGIGYMSFKMARKVGPTGKVYANDLQPKMLERLKANAAKEKITIVETVLGSATATNLPRGAIDLALMVDVYHELSDPQRMLRDIRESLKPNGRLVLLEYRKEDPKIPIREEHKMSVAEVKTELEAEGFTLSKTVETLPWQHILILTRNR